MIPKTSILSDHENVVFILIYKIVFTAFENEFFSEKSQGFVQEFVPKHMSIVVIDSLKLFKKIRIHF